LLKRDGGNGDVFGYDLNDQVTAAKLYVSNPDTTPIGNQTIYYDANGNRADFDGYSTNNLNQYTSRNSAPATYDTKGNLASFNGWASPLNGQNWTYSYDAQNRLISATNGSNTATFTYDGLNRQVSRTINGGAPIYSVWDGWNLIEEIQSGSVTAAYVSGAGGLVKNLVSNQYFYQDASGSTSHLASNTGQLLEWYRYDLQGTPVFYNASNTQLSTSNYSIRHLFTGQQWYSELGLYDLRNRFYSPDLGRFLQPDPIGFAGDPGNIYRYAGNNPVRLTDPLGLYTLQIGWSINANWGVVAWNGTVGFAFDTQGNIGGFGSNFLGVGAGLRGSTGVSIAVSNANTISGLGKFYTNLNGGAAAGGSLSGQYFTGTDSTNNKPVIGGGIVIGAGVGGGVSGGGSYTSIYPIWSASGTSNTGLDASSVEEELTAIANELKDLGARPLSIPSNKDRPFDNINLSLGNFAGGGLGDSGSFGNGNPGDPFSGIPYELFVWGPGGGGVDPGRVDIGPGPIIGYPVGGGGGKIPTYELF
jgi:RHS repeat-associated protein